MTDWIELGTGVAMMLPALVLLFFVAWCSAQERGMSFSEFVKRTLTIAVNVLQFSVLIFITLYGVLLILKAFR